MAYSKHLKLLTIGGSVFLSSLSLLLSLLGVITSINAAGASDYYYGSSSSQATTAVRRIRYLDHWDSDTLAYYLDNYPGYDVAIMFYAQWDQNSHAFAPYWDKIAEQLNAGSTESRLIMALFDCELSTVHMQLCSALEVTAYPTMMFVGAGPYHDTDFLTRFLFGQKRSAGPMGPSPIPNTVKFQGNWQYVGIVSDWIRTMQALSNWHTWSTQGFGRRLRNLFVPQKRDKSSLPVGIPPAAASAIAASKPGSGGGGGSVSGSVSSVAPDSSSAAQIKELEQKIELLNKQTTQYDDLVTKSNIMIDTMLFPVANSTNKDEAYIDVFKLLSESNGWDENASTNDIIMRSCVAELSLDFCQRVASHEALDIVEKLDGITSLEEFDVEDLEKEIMVALGEKEPYCVTLEECLENDFGRDGCKPKSCPFQESMACRYMTVCMVDEIQDEYKNAMGLGTTTNSASGTTASTSAGSWGMV